MLIFINPNQLCADEFNHVFAVELAAVSRAAENFADGARTDADTNGAGMDAETDGARIDA